MKQSSEIILEGYPEGMSLGVKFDSAVKADNFAKELTDLCIKYDAQVGVMGYLLMTDEPDPEKRTLSEQPQYVSPGETYHKTIRRYKELK